ncbi:MAG: hypothetical protein GF350_14395, partial [Chitinivibrionales bacterium]|nr:hypothetical protein [Chitinivibrionales bacterium]
MEPGKSHDLGHFGKGIEFMKKLLRLTKMLGPFSGLLLVFILFMVLAPSAFYSLYNIKTIITQTVIIGIGALGMTLVIISGGIDLSIGSVIALGTVVTARMLNIGAPDTPLWVSFAAVAGAVGLCAFCGFLNGIISASLRIVPFIVTLGMMQIARGTAKWIGEEQTVIAPQTWLNRWMEVEPAPSWL